jgi:hypothetical protein
LWLIKIWFSATTFVVQIATFAKPENVSSNFKTDNMTTTEWLLQLKKDGLLAYGQKNGKDYLHLKTPCKIHLTDNATKQLRDNYDPKKEKGGVLVARPKKMKSGTHLTVDSIIFLTNVSDSPANSYLPDSKELHKALNDTLAGQSEKTLPIRFHTHPTHSDNPVYEIFNYLFQSNTSQQDRIVSDHPVSIGDIKLLMPRSLVLKSSKATGKMFVGFYNGLIAPIEFDTHKNEQMQKAMDEIFNSISAWAKKGNNKVLALGGGALLAFLLIRYSKTTIPVILLLIAMLPMFINSEHGKPKYFAQVTGGKVTIDIP